MEQLSPSERRAYDLIESENGMLQSQLWKALDANSRKGSRLARSLQEKGLIEREETVSEGRTTYLLQPVDKDQKKTQSSVEWEEPSGETSTGSDADSGLDDREERGLSLIQERNGIYQSEFWKELDVSSRVGSRIATNLEDNGLIRREETTYDGQRTYLLLPAKKDLDFSLLMAGDRMSPLVNADEDVDPIESGEFTEWLLQL